MSFKILHLSDTHGTFDYQLLLNQAVEVDLIIHSGDFMNYGDESWLLTDYLRFVEEYPAKHSIIVPGNHDRMLVDTNEEYLDKYNILVNKTVTIDGYKIHGTPWQPYFFNWAFNLDFHELTEKHDEIPLDVDILITHCPPHGILDYYQGSCGDEALTLLLPKLTEMKLCMFGHIHESYGIIEKNGVIFKNGAIPGRKEIDINELIVELD